MAATQQASSKQGGSTRFLDTQALMAIRSLELRARLVVEGFWHGLHRSPYHGFSVEFTEYRQYTPGDDPRYLDWKLYARSDRHYLKKFEDETNLRCHILVDHSRSMHFGTTGYTKSEFAATMAATLAWFLNGQGDAIGLMLFDETIHDYLPPRHRPGHLRRIMLALEKRPMGRDSKVDHALERVAALSRRRSMILLISDFLMPIEQLEVRLAPLAAAGHEVLLFQPLDPSEADFSFNQAKLFEDVESGRELYIDPDKAREEYRERFEEHQATLRTLCNRHGIPLRTLLINERLDSVLLEIMRRRKLSRAHSIRQRRGTA